MKDALFRVQHGIGPYDCAQPRLQEGAGLALQRVSWPVVIDLRFLRGMGEGEIAFNEMGC